MRWRIEPSGIEGDLDLRMSGPRPTLTFDLPVGESALHAEVTAYLCQSDEELCRVDRVTLPVPLRGELTATTRERTLWLELELEPLTS